MVLLIPTGGRVLADADQLTVHVAGAELNACAAFAALGGASAFATRLGDDPLSEQIGSFCRRMGVELLAETDATRPTGMFLKDTSRDDVRHVFYYRRGSAAASVDARFIDLVDLSSSDAVLVSGLTAALSPSADLMFRALGPATRRAGTRLIVDANLRPALGRLTESISALRSILADVDILVLGVDEGEAIFDESDPARIIRAGLRAGCRDVVVKDGDRGCHFIGEDGGIQNLAAEHVTVVDTVGAGDAFTGSYAWARQNGWDRRAAASLATRVAADVVSAPGDTDGLPSAARAAELIHQFSKGRS